MRWDDDQTVGVPFAEVGGRPLGIDFDAAGNLWIANAYTGLMKLSATGDLTTVVTEVDGIAVRYADDVAIAPTVKFILAMHLLDSLRLTITALWRPAC